MIKISKVNIQQDDIDRLVEVIESGNLVHGKYCNLFQEKLGSYLSVDHSILVSSGTAALYLSLLALDIGPEHAVLVPNFTFPATVNVVKLVGATPVLVDVDATTYSMTSESLARAIKSYQGDQSLKAVIPVHEFGFPSDMINICQVAHRHDLYVVEDAACALGATIGDKKAGTYGDIGCFSFHPRKVITTGEGGLVVTSDQRLAERIELLKNHGIQRDDGRVDFAIPGHNFRLTDFQAALGVGQLERLDGWIASRTQLATKYHQLLQPLVERGSIYLPDLTRGHTWQTYMILLSEDFNRDLVIKRLRSLNVETNIGAQCISSIVHMQEYSQTQDLTVSRRLGKSGLALPMCEAYSEETLTSVVHNLTLVLDGFGA